MYVADEASSARVNADGPHITYCRLCEAACGLIAEVRDGRITKVSPDRDHPVSTGHLCVKGPGMVSITYDPDRVLTPLKRVGGPGEFVPVSWDEALTDIASRLKTVTDRDGAEAIGIYSGNPTAFGVMHHVYSDMFAKWLRRAVPCTVQHVVWSFPDVNETWAFYRDRLGFRLSDVQLGSGLYVRADGAPDHHNIFIADAGARHLGFDGTIRFHHANFGVEDIDEIMVGKNYMERKGWPKSSWGLGRHRISSGAFLYLNCPAGGEAEYGADVDMLDDRWMPRVWEGKFGSNIFIHDLPPFLHDAVEWNVGFCDPMSRYPAADTPGESAAPSAQAAMTR